MPLATIKLVLLWCIAFNYGILLLWVALAILAHDAFYRLNARLFRVTPQTYDAINYGGIAAYKMLIIFFNLVPYVALLLST
jgi:hypothetical protein